LPSADDIDWASLRRDMVARQIEQRGVRHPGVLAAMRRVPRHLFIPDAARAQAYDDCALPLKAGQTISQPYVVAAMTQAVADRVPGKILEVGTGSGYQAAVLTEMGADVYTIEVDPDTAAEARRRLGELGFHGVHARAGDGARGWPEAAPFDGILVTAATTDVPPALLAQAAEGGRIVAPLGDAGQQSLVRWTRRGAGWERESMFPVRFVPLHGGNPMEES
jgi:protein-L-isoaspartate(D-aspartate) O-methyltransferase